MDSSSPDLLDLLQKLNAIGVALSAEDDHRRLLEMILMGGKDITNADGGTLYSKTDDDRLKFEILASESLGLRMGGTSPEPVPFPALALYDENGRPNTHMVACAAALSGTTINVPDAYTSSEYDFSGTRAFDKTTGYRSRSFLTVPMRNHEGELIGVLQLINARSPQDGSVMPFSKLDQQLVESLASQAAVAITNRSLIEGQRKLFDSLIQLIANAIDEKSPYTAGHCRRVPVLTDMIADAACRISSGPLKDFSMTDQDRYELSVAAWLHDCGKITTPEYVVDKATKLETIFDRIKLVDIRFEVLKRDAQIAALRNRLHTLDPGGDGNLAPEEASELRGCLRTLDEDRDFLRACNVGTESISDEQKARIEEIAGYQWCGPDGAPRRLLNDEEVENLQISRGTLNASERQIINNHVSVTIKMLRSLPYPKHLRRVPEYAGGHHEHMDGTGYPLGLRGEQMSIPARMMVIADVFEALTAKDRPYKEAMPLSQALNILGRMRLANHVDADLFDVFIREGVYLDYARRFLRPEQIDTVDPNLIPGYDPGAVSVSQS